MYLKYSTRSLGGVVCTIVHTTSSVVSTSGHLGVLPSIYGLRYLVLPCHCARLTFSSYRASEQASPCVNRMSLRIY